jgi:hypothetical protein
MCDECAVADKQLFFYAQHGSYYGAVISDLYSRTGANFEKSVTIYPGSIANSDRRSRVGMQKYIRTYNKAPLPQSQTRG